MLCKHEVIGSIPFTSTKFLRCVDGDDMLRFHGKNAELSVNRLALVF